MRHLGAARLSRDARTEAIRRETARLCLALCWAPLHEVRLANGRRADILALRPDGGFVCIEIKSGLADFRADRKWPDYRDYADALCFAVDGDFPLDVLPVEAGLIVVAEEAALIRQPPSHPIAPARRKALTLLFARLGALRLQTALDPTGAALIAAATRAE